MRQVNTSIGEPVMIIVIGLIKVPELLHWFVYFVYHLSDEDCHNVRVKELFNLSNVLRYKQENRNKIFLIPCKNMEVSTTASTING